MSEKSKSTGGKRVSENSTGGRSGAIRSSGNPFETSRRDKPQYFVDVVKDKQAQNNIREDMEDRWVTKLSEDRKRFYLLAPHTWRF